VASYVAEGNKEFAQRELLVLQQLIDEDPHERADFIVPFLDRNSNFLHCSRDWW
jgi:hypothetical protein